MYTLKRGVRSYQRNHVRITKKVLHSAMDDAIFIALQPIIARALEAGQLGYTSWQGPLNKVTLGTELEIKGDAIELMNIVLTAEEQFGVELREEEIWIKPYLKSQAYGADCITARHIVAGIAKALIRKHT